MRARLACLALLFAALLSAPSLAKSSRKKGAAPDARTAGLGRNCKKSADCRSRAQRCLKESDANGKELPVGFCVLPCLSYESGTTKVISGQPLDPAEEKGKKEKVPPPRCPAKFLCRSAGNGVPIDMCVKE